MIDEIKMVVTLFTVVGGAMFIGAVLAIAYMVLGN
jgi:hypothetical protein